MSEHAVAISGGGPTGLMLAAELLRTGYEQVRSVVAALAGDMESARSVERVLAQTGVCNLRPAAHNAASEEPLGATASACCDSGSPHESSERTAAA